MRPSGSFSGSKAKSEPGAVATGLTLIARITSARLTRSLPLPVSVLVDPQLFRCDLISGHLVRVTNEKTSAGDRRIVPGLTLQRCKTGNF